MRLATPPWIALMLSVGLFTGMAGCSSEVTPRVVAGVDACNECGMVIDQVNQACGYVAEGEFVIFDSPVCLLRSFESCRREKRSLPDAMYFAGYHGTGLQAVEHVTFLLTNRIPTVMAGGVVCFASREAAESMRGHPDDVVTDWSGFRTVRGEPDAVVDVVFDAGGMTPEVVDVAKGDLLLLRARGDGLDSDLNVSVKGYPEVVPVTLPASGDEVEIRLLATRPGAGFPIVDTDADVPLGRLRVSGAHTTDEEAV